MHMTLAHIQTTGTTIQITDTALRAKITTA